MVKESKVFDLQDDSLQNDLKDENNDDNMTAPKRRRGRPRKNQIIESTEKSKKKGRKPKDFGTYVKHVDDKDNEEEPIILNMKFNLNELEDDSDSETEVGNSFNEELGTETKDSVFQKINAPDSSSPNQTTGRNIFTINDTDSESSSDEEDFDDSSNKKLLNKIKEQTKLIKKLEDEVENYKEIVRDSDRHGMNDRRAKKMKMELVLKDSKTGQQIIPEKTDICCWWCTHNFDGAPFFIPEKFHEETYEVFGCFCSYNCAAAYNLNMNDHNVWNRYSILKKMYSPFIDNIEEQVIAPAREVFEKFGGTLTYEHYLKNIKTNKKEFRLIMPPLVPIVPYIEESTNGQQRSQGVRFSNNPLVLKRSKPLPSAKNTFDFGLVKQKRRR